MAIWIIFLFILIGLFLTGLFLFPFRLHIAFYWESKKTPRLEVSFFKWILYRYEQNIEETEFAHDSSSVTYTPKTNVEEIFYTPSEKTSSTSISTLKPQIKPVIQLEDSLETPSTETFKKRILKILCNQDLWMSLIKYLLSLIKPSFGLLKVQMNQLELQYSQKDPILLAQIQGLWSSLKPILAPEQDVKLIIDWNLKNYLRTEGVVSVRHQLIWWLPWGFYLVCKFPWLRLWQAWRISQKMDFETNLRPLEKKVFQWLNA